MIKISLDGMYKLKRLEHGADTGPVFSNDFFPTGYLDAPVPGDVRSVLRAYGLIDGYYLGKNLDKERWIEESDWLYVKDFYCGEQLRGKENLLCFEGIDTLAEVWLNGTCLGKTRNMFLTYRFDVGEALRYGTYNTLAVRILSPTESVKGVDVTDIWPPEDTARMLLRKSQMNWGWDFCGHCLTNGIWKSVSIRSRDHALIGKFHLRTKEIRTDEAVLEADWEPEFYEPGSGKRLSLKAEFYYKNKLEAREEILLERCGYVQGGGTDDLSGGRRCSAGITVPHPHLWWPRPYGDPALYDVRLCLCEDGREVDGRQLRFGIRTVVLNQDRLPEGGRKFLFEINGKKIFVRGANWVPLNCVYSEIREEDYDFYFKRVLESNLSMLRVWGGGIYEPDYFFDFCDENGIMVFQDFMLACGIFPQHEEFLDQVSEEVRKIVDKYYNRASVVLWSADNELDESYEWAGQQERFRENRVNRTGVRRAIQECDPYRPFLISSPSSPFEEEEGGDLPASPLQGDMHIYLTRFVESSEYYYRKLLEFVPRFMSEYGFSSLPSEDSYHCFNFYGEKPDLARNPWLGELPWLTELGEKESAEELIYMTQYTHAQALKYWIEYLRCCKWTCGGSLYWKFNDPIAPNRENMLFPSLMSVIDFMRRPKLAYYYARRAYEDMILAFREEREGLGIYGCNETRQTVQGILDTEVLDYRGTVLRSWRQEAGIVEDASVRLFMIPKEEMADIDRKSAYVRCVFFGEGQRLENRFCLLEIGEFNQVEMPEAKLAIQVHEVDERTVEVTADTDCFAQDVTLTVQDTDVFFSDNMFHMDAGSRKNCRLRFEKATYRGKRLRVKAWNSRAVVVIL